jgi:hypothetical protein
MMWQSFLLSLLALGIGVVLLLWGYRTFLAMLPIFGFFAGFWLGAHTISLLFGSGFLADVTGFVTGFIFGVVAAVLSYLFYGLAIAFIAAAIGYGLGVGLMEAIGLDFWLIAVPVGVVAAILALVLTLGFNLQKYVVIALTAIAGANALILAGLLLFGRTEPGEIQLAGNMIQPVVTDGGFWLIVWLVFAIGGVVYQVLHNRAYQFDSDEYVLYYG